MVGVWVRAATGHLYYATGGGGIYNTYHSRLGGWFREQNILVRGSSQLLACLPAVVACEERVASGFNMYRLLTTLCT